MNDQRFVTNFTGEQIIENISYHFICHSFQPWGSLILTTGLVTIRSDDKEFVLQKEKRSNEMKWNLFVVMKCFRHNMHPSQTIQGSQNTQAKQVTMIFASLINAEKSTQKSPPFP